MSKVFSDFLSFTEAKKSPRGSRKTFLFPEVWDGFTHKWGKSFNPSPGKFYILALGKSRDVKDVCEVQEQHNADDVMTLFMKDPWIQILIMEKYGDSAIRYHRKPDGSWDSDVRRGRLVEVRVIPSTKDFGKWDKQVKQEKPLKDSDTILVYHGFHDPEDVILTLKYGLSGKVKARRIYSYENNNNPRGLFVTTRLDKAKEFAGGHKLHAIIEFHAKVKDLEAPVWPGGGYTVQGELAQYFKDDSDRDLATKAERERYRTHPDSPEAVQKSDRPEVAGRLFLDYEQQALFTGSLNPNGIRAVWVRKREPGKDYMRITTPFVRMKPKQFLKEFGEIELSKQGQEKERDAEKAFFPRERFDPAKLLAFYLKIGGGRRAKDSVEMQLKWFHSAVKIMNRDEYHMAMYLWPEQVRDFKRWSSRIKRPEDLERYLPGGAK